MPSSRMRLSGALVVGLVGSTLAVGLGVPAQAVSTTVVISEVYGGGTGSGAANTFGNDFIELYNRGTTAVNLSGWSVQYKSAAGTGAFQVQELNGTIPAGAHYLVQEGSFTTGTQYTADEQGSFSMAAGAGVVALVSNTTSYPTFGTTTGVDVAGNTANGLIDLVGYGTTATTYEGARTGVNLSSTLTAQRSALGADTDHNANDFTELAPTPQNCGCAVETAPDLVISEVFSHGTAGGAQGDDFVEVFNAGSSDADLTEVTLEVDGVGVELSGSLAAGAYQVVDTALGDDSGSTELVWENDDTTIDLVGWGTGAHEGDAAAPAGSASESAQRDDDNTDTNQNGADFVVGTPTRGSVYVAPPAELFTIARSRACPRSTARTPPARWSATGSGRRVS